MVEDAPELRAGRPAVVQRQVRLTAEIGGPELRRRRVVVRLDRLEQLERARRLAAAERERGGRHRQLNPGGQRRVREIARPARPTGATPRRPRRTSASVAAGPLEREVVAAELEPGPRPPAAPRRTGRRSRATRRPPSSTAPPSSRKLSRTRRLHALLEQLVRGLKSPGEGRGPRLPTWPPTSRSACARTRSSSRAIAGGIAVEEGEQIRHPPQADEVRSRARSPRAGCAFASANRFERDQRPDEVAVRRHEPGIETDRFAERVRPPARAGRTRRRRCPGC